ncbi:MAG: arylesterase [Lautropia sp.]|nr:arylesterase [Lautropia sp.]
MLLVLGDSLSAGYGLARGEGWVSLLEKRMQAGASKARKGWQIVNASISGETTAGGRSRLTDLLARHKPTLVIIELGSNDALRGLPLKAATENLREMLKAAQAAGASTMLVGMQMPPNYGPAYARQFEQMYQKLATETDSALVPFLLAGFGDDPAWFQADGIHPNAAAQSKMLDNAWSVLEGLLVEARLKFLTQQAIC